MASILDRYGIKEVADVTFYDIDDNGNPSTPVLYLDTLKVSTIEQTAEQADARGGKGNPKLITWDYGKEMTVTLEDALFSPKSMAVLLGNGNVTDKAASTVDRTVVVRATSTNLPDVITVDIPVKENGVVSAERKKVFMYESQSGHTKPGDAVAYAPSMFTFLGVFDERGNEVKVSDTSVDSLKDYQDATVTAGQKYFIKYRIAVKKTEIVVGADTFPGTYYVTGDTYARSDVTGKDQFFQFIIPKAKMTSEQTFTLEAEGDPTTFSMNLTVLRPEDGNMMKLVQYDIDETANS